MLIRKLISAFGATLIMVLLFSVLNQSGVGLFFGMYILPIILIYGIPSSILSDFFTRKTYGGKRFAAAAFHHIFLGALFVAVPTLIFDAENGNWIGSIRNNGFIFFTAVVSAFIFWCLDEAIKSEWFGIVRGKCLGILKRIGDMRV
ncbi:hypothetical protein LC048_11225 [Mesobacillus subterraneus]|uniref:hypothetical protein n=1 Tax=Mesobacillus subterraneus TaxID=285983 RepID=UPI001CFDC904|nr:hypothetical protein [Mesobacillus subterraneus]WLR57369.1 hypothetical protein LC048_11225 [Mesobacillus subterraneus]